MSETLQRFTQIGGAMTAGHDTFTGKPIGEWVRYSDFERALTAAKAEARREGWQPIETAPTKGPVETLLLYVPELHGTGGPVLAHWAHGDDGEQPAFGPAWFYWAGYGFNELKERPTHWMRLPRCPSDWREPIRALSASKEG